MMPASDAMVEARKALLGSLSRDTQQRAAAPEAAQRSGEYQSAGRALAQPARGAAAVALSHRQPLFRARPAKRTVEADRAPRQRCLARACQSLRSTVGTMGMGSVRAHWSSIAAHAVATACAGTAPKLGSFSTKRSYTGARFQAGCDSVPSNTSVSPAARRTACTAFAVAAGCARTPENACISNTLAATRAARWSPCMPQLCRVCGG